MKTLKMWIADQNGMGKAPIDFQIVYNAFPNLTFESTWTFGTYSNFGKAFEHKNYDMIVTDNATGKTAYLHYSMYTDTIENNCYLEIQ